MEKKIVWICSDCGRKYGNKPVGIATWHEGLCDICGKKTGVTQPRDFGYLNKDKLPVEHISTKVYPTGKRVNEELFDWACSELEILEDNEKKQVLRAVISQTHKGEKRIGEKELSDELFTFFLWFRWNGEKYMDKSIERMIKTYLRERDFGNVLERIKKISKLTKKKDE